MDESASLIDLGAASDPLPGAARDRIPSDRTTSRTSRLDIAVVGPPGSGKSALVSALLRFSGSRDGAHASGLRVAAVSAPPISRLQVDTAGPAADSDPREITFTELDLSSSGDGLDTEGESRAPWPTRHALALVLCVDTREPEKEFWRRAWPRLARSLQISTGRSVLSLDGEERAPELRLGHDRVVILLTRADRQLQAWRGVGAGVDAAGDDLRSLACRIDPRRWLAEMLGSDLASVVRAQLRPQARLAVGIAACAGGVEEAVEELGVAETLEFLLTGEAREPLDLVAAVDEAPEPWFELEPDPERVEEQGAEAGARATARPRLFLKPPRAGRAGRASALARWLRLDSYSSRLLTKAARLEMELLARLLAGVALFELTVWTLLFNAIFHAEVTAISERSLAALGLGMLYAAVIVYLDRSFLVADPTQKGHRRAALFRICIVFLSALATSLAVDLIFFDGPIKVRRHEEQILAEIVDRAEGLQEDWDPRAAVQVGSKEGNPFLVMAAQATAELTDLRSERSSLSRSQAEAAEAARRGRQRVRELDGAIELVAREPGQQVPRDESSPSMEELLRRREFARKQAAKSEAEALELAARGTAVDARITGVDARLQALEEQADALVNEELGNAQEQRRKQKATSDRIVDWITFLRRSDPPDADDILTEPVPPQGEKPLEYRLSDVDLFERFRILFDLLAGRPPKWPDGGSDQLAELRQRFHLEDPAPCPAPVAPKATRGAVPALAAATSAPCDDTAWRRMQKRADFLTFSYFLLLFVAAVVPLSVLVVKLFLMPRALSCYYSLAHQAAAGDADAVLVAKTMKREGSL